MKKVLVDVDAELWGRVRACALQRNELVGSIVGKALRGYLGGHFGGGSVAGEEVKPAAAAERGEESRSAQVIRTGEKPSVDELKRVLAPLGVVTGRELVEGVAPGTVVSPPGRFDAAADPFREINAVTAREVECGQRADLARTLGRKVEAHEADPREAERQRIARQDHLRTHPEDASQASDDEEVGF